MKKWKNGGWKNGSMEEWKNEKMEEWKNGRMEKRKNGRMVPELCALIIVYSLSYKN